MKICCFEVFCRDWALDKKNRFIQTNNCFAALKEKHPYSSGDGTAESLCALSHGYSSIPPQTMATSPAGPSEPFSFLCHPFSLSFWGSAPLSSWALPGWKSFTGSCSTASNTVNSRLGCGTLRWAVCYSCHKVLNLEELLHGDRSVSEAGLWAAPAASCLCDLTVCVNQERVSARPATLISISLQITPRRQCEGGEL